MANVTQWFTWP